LLCVIIELYGLFPLIQIFFSKSQNLRTLSAIINQSDLVTLNAPGSERSIMEGNQSKRLETCSLTHLNCYRNHLV